MTEHATALTTNNNIISTGDTIKSVVLTDEVVPIIIPVLEGCEEQIRSEVKDIQQKYAELVSKEFDIPIADVLKCTPDNIVYEVRDKLPIEPPLKKANPSVKKSSKLALDSWEDASSVDELKSLKMTELKDILSSRSMKTSGGKSLLMSRVWGINHPEDAPKEEPKKARGRPSGKKSQTDFPIVDDSDADTTNDDDIQHLLMNTTTKTINGISVEIVESKGWVFTKEDDDVEWIGMMDPSGDTYTETDPPDELMKLYTDE